MVDMVIDIFTKERTVHGADVVCEGGEGRLLFSISATGMRKEHILRLIQKDFPKIKPYQQPDIGFTDLNIVEKDNKLYFVFAFPVTVDINEPKLAQHICEVVRQKVIATL